MHINVKTSLFLKFAFARTYFIWCGEFNEYPESITMSDQPQTRGALLIDEMMRIGARSYDERDPVAADNATQLRRHLLADPRFVEYSLEYINSAEIPENKKTDLRNQTRIAHEEALSQVPASLQNPAIQTQVNGLYDRFNNKGRADAGYTAPTPLTDEQNFAVQSRFIPQGSPVRVAARQHAGPVKATAVTAASVTREDSPKESPRRSVGQPENHDGVMAYTIKKGDNLSKIARDQYDLTDPKQIHQKAMEIARYNHLPNANRISVGQTLNLPGLAPQTQQPTDIIVNTARLNAGHAFSGGTTAAGKPLDTALGNDWARATAMVPESGLFAGIKPLADQQILKTVSIPETTNNIAPPSLLGDAWKFGGTHVPVYLRLPETAETPVIDSAKPAPMLPVAP